MTPQEKAQSLVDKYMPTTYFGVDKKTAKQCASIAVDEILALKREIWDDFHREYFEFWQHVKEEIPKI
jgi:hypothetical protein